MGYLQINMLNLLASFLLFLLALIHGRRSGSSVNAASFSPTQGPSPSFTEAPTIIAPSTGSFPPAQALAVVPAAAPVLTLQQDVDAVNTLLKLSWPRTGYNPEFTPNDCKTSTFSPKISCNCSADLCRVTAIQLRGQNLRGFIPEQIGNQLTDLTSLDLSSNKLRGPIPESIANLIKLSTLKLSVNKIEGPVPRFLAKMSSLQTLYLSSNLLSGSIPQELGSISALISLHLHNNDLSGELPQQLGDLTNLQDLDLSNNLLNGSLPSTFQNLQQLHNFNIRGNNFSGTIPVESISKWTALLHLDLSGNSFSGPPVPTAITALTEVTTLSITDLAQEGKKFLIPDVINNSVSWNILILRKCSLTGPIPAFIWSLSNLTYLDLSFNSLFGGIPANVGLNIQKLDSIFLRSNKLNGTLPEWLTKLEHSKVDVSENFFTNVTIPTGTESSNLNLFSCCNSGDLSIKSWQQRNYTSCGDHSTTYDRLYINCGGKEIFVDEKHYEADLGEYGASTFYLSDNKTWGYSSMGTFLDTNQRQYKVNETFNITHMADSPLYKDARISPISLKYYGFCLRNGDYTLTLHFAEIGWAANKARPQRRRVFDIFIQGGEQSVKDFNIEEEARGVYKDITKNFSITVSDERLEVHLYWSSKGSTPTRYYGPLISAISLSPQSQSLQDRSAPNPPSGRLPPGVIAAVILASATAFVALTLSISYKMGLLDVLKPSVPNEFASTELFTGQTASTGQTVSFEEIKAAIQTSDIPTATMTSDEGAGFGDYFKGVLQNQMKIAAKKISATFAQRIKKYMNEIGTHPALRHPNLVSLKGFVAKGKELFLVHEYLENSHLENALFGASNIKSSLDWIRRLRICLDAAKGLEFLHDEKESKPQMIHGDINPTNILLGKSFNAKIFYPGYAAELNEDEENSTRICWFSPGASSRNAKGIRRAYMAPERDQGFQSPEGDVYSFGIVMLETISGKSSSTQRSKDDNDKDVHFLEAAYVCQKQNNVIAFLDEDLGRSDFTDDEALKVLNLALECVSPAPKLRPAMSDVVKVLEGVLKVEESNRNSSVDEAQPGSTSDQLRDEVTSSGVGAITDQFINFASDD